MGNLETAQAAFSATDYHLQHFEPRDTTQPSTDTKCNIVRVENSELEKATQSGHGENQDKQHDGSRRNPGHCSIPRARDGCKTVQP